jgi:hypothetical protein
MSTSATTPARDFPDSESRAGMADQRGARVRSR